MADIPATFKALIDRVNETMLRLIAEDEPAVGLVEDYSFQGGGKRLRPLIFCLVTEALGRELGEASLEMSAAFEFLHMASLLHDDIVDLAELRRGRAAAHLAFGVPETVLAGDYLLAKAAGLGAASGNIDCVKIMCRLVRELSLGELSQLAARRQSELMEDMYFRIIYRKTAVLMEGTARSAALLAGASERRQRAAAEFARLFGLAFQIVDDILDYKGDAESFGKPVGHDLDEGKITLPFIVARDNLDQARRLRLCQLASLERRGQPERLEIRALVEAGGGLRLAEAKAEDLSNQALNRLEELPPGPAVEALMELTEAALGRRS